MSLARAKQLSRAGMIGVQIKALTKTIERLEAETAVLYNQRRALADERAALLSPFKIGDRVYKKGFPGKVWELTRIRGSDWDDDLNYFGNVVRKDGEPGARERRIFIWRSDELVKVKP